MIIAALRTLTFLILSNQCVKVEPLNILGVFPYQGKSHFYVFEPYLKELAARGHNVTVISYFPSSEPIKNYHDISLAGNSIVIENIIPITQPSVTFSIISAFALVYAALENCEIMLQDEEVQDLWKSDKKFDVVVAEQFNGDCALGLAYKLDAPVVGLTSHTILPYHYERFAISYNPTYAPGLIVDSSLDPSLYQRIERTFFYFYYNFIYKFFTQRFEYQTLSEHFENLPPLEELGRNIKFLLLYDNFILSGSRVFPSNVIEVGGYHVKKPKPLQEDLKNFIEEAEHGVIYISFGSMLKGSSLPRNKLKAILDALAKLPQKVIWKWETKSIPGKPKNVFVSKWLPQSDLLAHPNIVAFISHCGMLGITEAVHRGVPILGIPMFGDQLTNGAAVERSGFGLKLEMKELTKENLYEKLTIILDPNFRAKVKLLSKAWHDRPASAIDSAVHWTEFAAKYRNFTFRAAAVDVPLYQSLFLDIFAFIFVLPVFILFTVWYLLLRNKTVGKKLLINDKKKI